MPGPPGLSLFFGGLQLFQVFAGVSLALLLVLTLLCGAAVSPGVWSNPVAPALVMLTVGLTDWAVYDACTFPCTGMAVPIATVSATRQVQLPMLIISAVLALTDLVYPPREWATHSSRTAVAWAKAALMLASVLFKVAVAACVWVKLDYTLLLSVAVAFTLLGLPLLASLILAVRTVLGAVEATEAPGKVPQGASMRYEAMVPTLPRLPISVVSPSNVYYASECALFRPGDLRVPRELGKKGL